MGEGEDGKTGRRQAGWSVWSGIAYVGELFWDWETGEGLRVDERGEFFFFFDGIR